MHLPNAVIQKGRKTKDPTGVWLSGNALESVLQFSLPQETDGVWLSKDLWCPDPRVGLARDDETRRPREGELYSPCYVRLQAGTALATEVRGLPPTCELPGQITLGGESRMANVERVSARMLPDSPVERIRRSGRMTVCLLTPLRLDEETFESGLRPGATLGGAFGPLAGSVLVSACIGKPEGIGGWHPKKRDPLPIRSHIPVGSSLFLNLPEGGCEGDLEKMNGAKIGQRTEYGFGEIVIGTWQGETSNEQ
jgi:CRISPR-associated protein Cmr3